MTAPPEPVPDVLSEPTEPRQYDWDDDPHTCARYDRAWFDRDEE